MAFFSVCIRVVLAFVAMAFAVLAAKVDSEQRIIPNRYCAAILLTAAAEMVLSQFGVLEASLFLEAPLVRLGWAFGVVLFLVLFEYLWRFLGHGAHGLGFGDIKLIGASALWLGSFTPVMILFACVAAAFHAILSRVRVFAFGPYLVAGACVAIVLLFVFGIQS